MTMNRAGVLSLVKELGRDQTDDDTVAVYYDEVIEELARSKSPPLVDAALLTLTADTATYDYPTQALKILHTFFESKKLLYFPRSHLDAYDSDWRAAASVDPWAWTIDKETKRELRLFPPPAASTTLGMWVEPFGEDYPDDVCALIYGDNRETRIYDWMVYYIVFSVLEREFKRPSDHQDIEFGELCSEIAALFYVLSSGHDAE